MKKILIVLAMLSLIYTGCATSETSTGTKDVTAPDTIGIDTGVVIGEDTTANHNYGPKDYYDLGYSHYTNKEYDLAVNMLKKAIADSSDFISAYILLSHTYEGMGLNDAAEKTLLDAKRKSPTNPEIYYSLGRLYYDMGKYSKADEMYYNAIKADSTYAYAYLGLGLDCQMRNEKKKSIDFYRKAYKLNPKNEEVAIAYSKSLLELGKYNDAIPILEWLSSQHPRDLQIKLNLGDAYSGAKKYDKALVIFKQLAVSMPKYAPIYTRIAQAYQNLKQYNSAKKYYEKAIEVNPKSEPAYYLYAQMYIEKLKNFTKAKLILDRAEKVNPNSAAVPVLRGDIYLYKASKTSSYSTAIKTLKKAIAYYKIGLSKNDPSWSNYANSRIRYANKRIKFYTQKIEGY